MYRGDCLGIGGWGAIISGASCLTSLNGIDWARLSAATVEDLSLQADTGLVVCTVKWALRSASVLRRLDIG